jgi:hypothetical protein
MNLIVNNRLMELYELIRQRKEVIQTYLYLLYRYVFLGIYLTGNKELSFEYISFSQTLSIMKKLFFEGDERGVQENTDNEENIILFMHNLNIRHIAYRRSVEYCWRHGYFDETGYSAARVDRFVPTASQSIRPEASEIFPKIRAIIDRIQKKYTDFGGEIDSEDFIRQMRRDMAVELVRDGVCRNIGNAQPVVKLITQKQRKHLSPVLHLLLKRGLFDRLPHTHSIFDRILWRYSRMLLIYYQRGWI